jgi:hypothetical protein
LVDEHRGKIGGYGVDVNDGILSSLPQGFGLSFRGVIHRFIIDITTDSFASTMQQPTNNLDRGAYPGMGFKTRSQKAFRGEKRSLSVQPLQKRSQDLVMTLARNRVIYLEKWMF